MKSSSPAVSKIETPKENDPSIEAALEKERIERQRRAGRASTMLTDTKATKTLLGQ